MNETKNELKSKLKVNRTIKNEQKIKCYKSTHQKHSIKKAKLK